MKNDDNKVKFTEQISHNFRKRWLVNGTQLVLTIAVLFVAYFCLYLWLNAHELPEYDITTNKIYTLSDASKNVIKNIDKEIEILVYGFPDNSSLFDLLKQYNKTNNLITYRKITEENDIATVNKYGLSTGYYATIIRCGENEKTIDGSEFSVIDYTINQTVDVTEQTLTNSILALVEENKPKVYFTVGHDEVNVQNLNTITYLLKNEAFEYSTVNIDLVGKIPEDCDILAIISPINDFSEREAELIKEYINNGGSIYFSMGLHDEDVNLAKLQTVLDEFGVQVDNGFIVEHDENLVPSASYPFVFSPTVSGYNTITADIFTDSYLLLVESAKLSFKDEDTLKSLNVTKEDLAYSSEQSTFIDNLNADSISNAELTAQTGPFTVAASMVKKVSDDKESKLVIISNTAFMVDQYYEAVSDSAKLSYFGSNKDFVVNAMSYLGNKNSYLTIRKDYATNTYKPTDKQNTIVLTIVFSVPLFILAAGAIVWNHRKKRK